MFERFDEAARHTVVIAQEQARGLNHPYIGTEHLLLALLTPAGQSVAADTLRAVGTGYEQVREEIIAVVGRGEETPMGNIAFTPRSKKVLELSLRESLRLKEKTITPEHILLGLLREGEGLACQILTKHGVDLARLRDEVAAHCHTRGVHPGPQPGASTMTEGAAGATHAAFALAGGDPVGSQHLLLALAGREHSAAQRILAELGVTREAVEAKLAELGVAGTTDEPPERAGARRTTLQVEGDVITVRVEEPELAGRLRAVLGRPSAAVASPPGIEGVWRAVVPAVRSIARRLESSKGAEGGEEWLPPGWGDAGVATYAVLSKPEGPTPRLWVAEGADEAEVRAWLATWLGAAATNLPRAEAVRFLAISVGRTGGEFVSSGFMLDTRLAPQHWPAAPLADLIDAALADLGPPAPQPA